MAKMSEVQRIAVRDFHNGVTAKGNTMVAPARTIAALIRNGWAWSPEGARLRAQYPPRSAYITRAGLIAAGIDMDAIHGEALDEDASREGDDFKPADRPSLAALHRQWLDRGLPASTWVTWLRQYNEMYGEQPRPVEHAHRQTQCCYPRCPRWGS